MLIPQAEVTSVHNLWTFYNIFTQANLSITEDQFGCDEHIFRENLTNYTFFINRFPAEHSPPTKQSLNVETISPPKYQISEYTEDLDRSLAKQGAIQYIQQHQ